MKNTKRLRLLYQDSEAFKAGIEVGRKETVDKACGWLLRNAKDYVSVYFGEGKLNDEWLIKDFRKAMEE